VNSAKTIQDRPG